jgi:hypothetical protein
VLPCCTVQLQLFGRRYISGDHAAEWSGSRHHTCTEAERPLLSTAGGTLRSLLCPLVPDVPPWPILSDETQAAIPSLVPSRIRLWRAEDALALAPDDGMSEPAPMSSAVTFGTRFCTTSDLERLEGCTMTFGTAHPLDIAAPVQDASLVRDGPSVGCVYSNVNMCGTGKLDHPVLHASCMERRRESRSKREWNE